jgi:hypothetical protein
MPPCRPTLLLTRLLGEKIYGRQERGGLGLFSFSFCSYSALAFLYTILFSFQLLLPEISLGQKALCLGADMIERLLKTVLIGPDPICRV